MTTPAAISYIPVAGRMSYHMSVASERGSQGLRERTIVEQLSYRALGSACSTRGHRCKVQTFWFAVLSTMTLGHREKWELRACSQKTNSCHSQDHELPSLSRRAALPHRIWRRSPSSSDFISFTIFTGSLYAMSKQ